jgi:hypothetical protein
LPLSTTTPIAVLWRRFPAALWMRCRRCGRIGRARSGANVLSTMSGRPGVDVGDGRDVVDVEARIADRLEEDALRVASTRPKNPGRAPSTKGRDADLRQRSGRGCTSRRRGLALETMLSPARARLRITPVTTAAGEPRALILPRRKAAPRTRSSIHDPV